MLVVDVLIAAALAVVVLPVLAGWRQDDVASVVTVVRAVACQRAPRAIELMVVPRPYRQATIRAKILVGQP